MNRLISILLALALALCMTFTLAVPARAATPTFTGDVTVDFTGQGVLTIPDPGGVGDVGLPLGAPPGTVSGWDMADLRLTYDVSTDTLYVGIDTYGIAGDADGNGDPSGTPAWLAANAGADLANLSSTESIAVYFDLNQDGTFDVIAGVPALTDITGFTVANFAGTPWNPAYAFGAGLPTHTGSYHANPSVADPDFEFTILNFSTLPGQDALLARFTVWAFMGSIEDDGIGEDFIQYDQSPSTITTITSSAITVGFGGTVDLTVTEHNGGDVALTSPQVTVTKNGAPLATLTWPPTSGDVAGPGVLNVGETWTWANIDSGVITATTTFEALGFGTDSLGNEISYDEGYAGERDQVTVGVTGETCATTSTGTGTACFGPSAGTLTGLGAIAEGSLPPAAQSTKPIDFPDGLFSFNITGLSNGATVNATIALPAGAAPTQYWKYHASEGGWIQIPMTVVGPPNVIRITLQDGGLGDDDLTANGVIVDQGGPGNPGAVGWETYPVDKLCVFIPWIALLAAIVVGTSLLVSRHRQAQS